MRITGGLLRSRRLRTVSGRVRPTQDRVREALFSMLADRLAGCRFLDLFAGSGVVGLEAFSRGAECVYWVESEARVERALRANVGELCAVDEQHERVVRVVRSDVFRFLARADNMAPFDIIFADPPYERSGSNAGIRKALQAVGNGPILTNEGVFVAEQAVSEPIERPAGFQLVREKRYGGTCLRFYQRN